MIGSLMIKSTLTGWNVFLAHAQDTEGDLYRYPSIAGQALPTKLQTNEALSAG